MKVAPKLTESDLRGVYAKLDRGRKHIDALDESVERLVKNHPDGLADASQEMDFKVGEYRVTIGRVADTPIDIALELGDAVHNIRSALDHLAWQLVVANRETPTGATQFPVLGTAPQTWKKSMTFAKATIDRVAGMHPDHVSTIERLQPYIASPEAPEESTLWWLHRLDVIDKHKVLHIPEVWLRTLTARSDMPPDVPLKLITPFEPGPLKPDTQFVWRFNADRLRWYGSKVKVNVQWLASCDVALGECADEGEPYPFPGVTAVEAVDLMHQHVRDTVIPLFTSPGHGVTPRSGRHGGPTVRG